VRIGALPIARTDLLAPTDMHPAEFTRSFDFDYADRFYPAFDRYPPYGDFEIHIHSSVDVCELE
jgi:hypothetical protein